MKHYEIYKPQMGERLRPQSEFRVRFGRYPWVGIVTTRDAREDDDRYLWRAPLMCGEVHRYIRNVSAEQPLTAILRGGPHDGAIFLVAQLPEVMWTQTVQNGPTPDYIHVHTPTPCVSVPQWGGFSAYIMAGMFGGGFLYLFDHSTR